MIKQVRKAFEKHILERSNGNDSLLMRHAAGPDEYAEGYIEDEWQAFKRGWLAADQKHAALVEAVEEYLAEVNNPAPDSIMRRSRRDDMRAALAASKESKQ